MKGFLIALQFLTRIPINIEGTIEEEDLVKSVYYYPLIGLIMGIILVLFYDLLTKLVPFGARPAIILTVLIFLSGGLHLDGFIDTMDGLCSGAPQKKALEIMRDSRMGAFGAVSLVVLLLLKLNLLQNFNSIYLRSLLLVMPVLSRFMAVAAMPLADYARSGSGLGQVLVQKVGWKEVLFTFIFTLAVSIFVLGFKSFLLIPLLFLFLWIWTAYLKNKIGGITGDTLGATIEITEVLIIFILLII